ncbi:CDP-diacylglycerol--glycerol-3-phosphate 3-phosphatidyltransferase [Helicobacter sp. 11S02629-2]|uniref:CDP-diacylglycerol--glycerol-3-phosphate 3-phosphatidyltransferase n=1 Tax=Helicobacter sp. 11S02629-2 TaxID=1476195 RepID=UPI000BA576CA|nr:CDP-diacylglycerol--glycerol-3-phosphate 3-phosphatidyltransferase [Helicobacter sp. 11S02629-2]PAF45330.1 CDP-diacylglycerol--glycerol-3-phosphate 3-phosphatidyltransferase [Helicobacter sp. 11S02629-2]
MRNIPNILTVSRMILAILLLALILHWSSFVPSYVDKTWLNYFACLIFCLASITDFFDGYVARHFNLKSAFGEVFDPLADKMLILAAFFGLLFLHRANTWAIFIILSREFFITGLRVVAAMGKESIAASSLGKYKTGFQILAIAFLLADYFPGGDILLWIAVVITLYSGLDYAFKYYKALKR